MENEKTAKTFVIKGDICSSVSKGVLRCSENSYAVCENGICAGVFNELPGEYSELPVEDFSGMIVMPGMVDLHIHAPQYMLRGIGMDEELLDWLYDYVFPEEARFVSPAYALSRYTAFAEALKRSATTRACVFATVHVPATFLLMDLLEDTGLRCYAGKVNMDRNAPDTLTEASALVSADATREWLDNAAGRFENVKPILTPRFLPSCTPMLLSELRKIREEYDVPVQSHLSENLSEVEFVKELFPKAAFYGDGYDLYGLFGQPPGGSGRLSERGAQTIMAHCIYSGDDELARIKENGVTIAHCPSSNMNLASGIAPVRKFLDMGLRVGLGTDVAGGETESIFRAIADTVQVSKLYWRLVDSSAQPLSFEEAFWMATAGGGSFFGKVGRFEEGCDFDAIVIDDSSFDKGWGLTLRERAERAVYQEADRDFLVAKYVRGRRII